MKYILRCCQKFVLTRLSALSTSDAIICGMALQKSRQQTGPINLAQRESRKMANHYRSGDLNVLNIFFSIFSLWVLWVLRWSYEFSVPFPMMGKPWLALKISVPLNSTITAVR